MSPEGGEARAGRALDAHPRPLAAALTARRRSETSLLGLLTAAVLVLGGGTRLAAAPPDWIAPAEVWEAAGVARAAPPVPAPDFGLRDLAGRTVRLAGFRGRVVLLYFWATW